MSPVNCSYIFHIILSTKNISKCEWTEYIFPTILEIPTWNINSVYLEYARHAPSRSKNVCVGKMYFSFTGRYSNRFRKYFNVYFFFRIGLYVFFGPSSSCVWKMKTKKKQEEKKPKRIKSMALWEVMMMLFKQIQFAHLISFEYELCSPLKSALTVLKSKFTYI